jgi:hypothetical protein
MVRYSSDSAIVKYPLALKILLLIFTFFYCRPGSGAVLISHGDAYQIT